MRQKLCTRLYSPEAGEKSLQLEDENTEAVRRSVRLKQGEQIACFNGDGNEYIYTIEASSKSQLSLVLEKSHPNPADNFPDTAIFIATVKGKTKDRIVRELPPLGASRIVFYVAERSISKLTQAQVNRLQKIAIESCRQCGRSTIPQVEITHHTIFDMLQKDEYRLGQKVLFWEKISESMPTLFVDSQAPVSLIFGPEGGFTTQEVNLMIEDGAGVYTLGKRILRTELAVIVGVTLIQAQRNLFT